MEENKWFRLRKGKSRRGKDKCGRIREEMEKRGTGGEEITEEKRSKIKGGEAYEKWMRGRRKDSRQRRGEIEERMRSK